MDTFELDLSIFSELDWNPADFPDIFDDYFIAQAQTQRPGVDTINDVCTDKQLGPAASNKSIERKVQSPQPLNALMLPLTTQTPLPRDVLKTWTMQNPDILYPTRESKLDLSAKTGYTVKQISTWFANYRQRTVKPVHITLGQKLDMTQSLQRLDKPTNSHNKVVWSSDSSSSTSSNKISSNHVAAPSSPQRPLSPSRFDFDTLKSEQTSDVAIIASYLKAGVSLLDVWRFTLPTDNRYDYVEEDHIESSITETKYHPNNKPAIIGHPPETLWRFGPGCTSADMMDIYRSSHGGLESLDSSKRLRSARDRSGTREVRRKTSAGSADLRQSEYDRASATSGGSTSSGASHRSSASRRGRRIQRTNSVCFKPYYCEKCSQGFSRKSDLTKHEKTICGDDRRWTCRPIDFDVMTKPESRGTELPLCLCGLSPHACDHNMLRCWARPEADRTFYRLDHIKNHTRGMHQLESHMARIDFTRLRSDGIMTGYINSGNCPPVSYRGIA